MSDFDAEVRERWAATGAYLQSQKRTSKYSHADFAAAKVDQESVTEAFAMAFGNRVGISSATVQQLVVAHREAISKWFYDCSPEMQKNLAQMYIADEPFKTYYDSRARGLAQYVHDAIMIQPS